MEHKGKTYYPEDEVIRIQEMLSISSYVDFMDSDGYIIGFMRPGWQVLDEELEELNIHIFKDTTKKELKDINKNVRLYNKLINFCVKRFEDYQVDYKL